MHKESKTKDMLQFIVFMCAINQSWRNRKFDSIFSQWENTNWSLRKQYIQVQSAFRKPVRDDHYHLHPIHQSKCNYQFLSQVFHIILISFSEVVVMHRHTNTHIYKPKGIEIEAERERERDRQRKRQVVKEREGVSIGRQREKERNRDIYR